MGQVTAFGAPRSVARLAVLALILLVAACGARPVAQFGDPSPVARVERIYVATEYATDNLGPIFGEERPKGLNFLHMDVSIPPTHEPGTIEWPDGAPDAASHFVVTDAVRYPAMHKMVAQMRRSAPESETILFVPGYNSTYSESLFRFAQMRTDFDLTAPGVLFAWPSAGDPRGYIYDRDSVLYSRDGLTGLIQALGSGNGRVIVLAHSMGSQLVMEGLRQLAVSGDRRTLNRIEAVVLMSPDIDPDLFRRQTEAIGKLPDPFLIFTSQEDRALTLSSFLTGRKPRLGTVSDPRQLEGVEGVRVIDFTGLEDDSRLNHSTPVTSPAAIELLRGLIAQARAGGDAFADYLALGTRP